MTIRVILIVTAAYVFILSGILGDATSEIEKDGEFDRSQKSPAR